MYRGVDYATGEIAHTFEESKSGTNFLIFRIALATADGGRKIRLACDNGRFHHTRAVGILHSLAIAWSEFIRWSRGRGTPNRHNALVPRDF